MMMFIRRNERKNMGRLVRIVFIATAIVLFGLLPALAKEQDSLSFNPFGKIMIYRKTPHPSQVVLFVSGDGGWEKGVVDMAKSISTMDALVLGIDFPRYQKSLASSKGSCAYCAADFENLSKFAQKTLGFPNYIKPTLVGYSSGATLVYALLVQAPHNSYQGVVSLGFCPDLILPKPMCRGNGLEWTGPFKGKGYIFSAAKQVDAPWIVFQGLKDQVCDPPETEDFVQKVGNAEIVTLPKVGHGFSASRNWLPQFDYAFGRLFKLGTLKPHTDSSLSDLPLVEIPSTKKQGDSMAIIVSGDGGWAGIDREIGTRLAENAVPVVGLNSLSYFWTARSPETASKDLERIIDHYLTAWDKKNVILVGYSFGADALPFMISRLSENIRHHVAFIALISPSHDASFEFHLSDWLGGSPGQSGYKVMPEIENLKDYPLVCVAGSDESDNLCKDLTFPWVKSVILPGGHHLGGDYQRITQTILAGIKPVEK